MVRLIFARFGQLGSARQVLLSMLAEGSIFRGRPTARSSSPSTGRRSATATRLVEAAELAGASVDNLGSLRGPSTGIGPASSGLCRVWMTV